MEPTVERLSVRNGTDLPRINLALGFIASGSIAQAGLPQQTTANRPWYVDFDALTAFASIGALAISLLALFQAYQSVSEQKKREKKEELRNLLEKILSLREEFDRQMSKTTDINERSISEGYLSFKLPMYLYIAESIAAEIPSHVSWIEYQILAKENFNDYDFLQAKSFHEKAVKASQRQGNNKLAKHKALCGLDQAFIGRNPVEI